MDENCYSFFSRMRISHGSNVVEDTQNCGRLWQLNINYEMYPSDMIRVKPRNLDELLRAFNMLTSNLGSGVLDYNTYASTATDLGTIAGDANTANVPHKSFVAGIDLHRFNQTYSRSIY